MDRYDWTEERETQLKRLWLDEGRSASECALQLGGGLTRSAVIGKVHRMKLGRAAVKRATAPRAANPAGVVARAQRFSGQRVPRRPKAAAAVAAAPSVAMPAAMAPLLTGPELVALVPAEDAPPPLGLSLLDLGQQTCRWPVGGAGAQMEFCGRHTAEDAVYCDYHRRRAYGGAVALGRADARKLLNRPGVQA